MATAKPIRVRKTAPAPEAKPPRKRSGGRQGTKPMAVIFNLERVKKLAASGFTVAQIAQAHGVGRRLLFKRMAEDPELKAAIDEGSDINLDQIEETLYQIAKDQEHRGCVTAAIFIMKTKRGWRETNALELTGKDGQPLQHGVFVMPMATMSADEWAQRARVIADGEEAAAEALLAAPAPPAVPND
jgi:hypothetical protein